MLKRFLTALLGIAMYLSVAPCPAHAGSGAPLNDPTITSASAAYWARATASKDAGLAAAKSRALATPGARGVSPQVSASYSTWGYILRTINPYKQETPYYCGPASARQSLGYHKLASRSSAALPSQTTLANKIGTTTSGSLTTKIAAALNSYDGVFGSISYVASNLSDVSNPTQIFYDRIGAMLYYGSTIPIILTATQYIPRYAGHASRHYMCVAGIDDRASNTQMRSVDPNYDPAQYGMRWESMGSASGTGLCSACYHADLAGTNYAMAW